MKTNASSNLTKTTILLLVLTSLIVCVGAVSLSEFNVSINVTDKILNETNTTEENATNYTQHPQELTPPLLSTPANITLNESENITEAFITEDILNPSNEPLEERNTYERSTKTYLFAIQKQASLDNNGEVNYYVNDHLGGTNKIYDKDGNETASNEYYAYGEDKSKTGVNQDFKFTGKQQDDSTGLYYYGARYYDPIIGRFAAADSVKGDINNPQSLNRYSYTLNNPLKYTDPTGNLALSTAHNKGTATNIENQFIEAAFSEGSLTALKKVFGDAFDIGNVPGNYKVEYDPITKSEMEHYPNSQTIKISNDKKIVKDDELTNYGKSASVHETAHVVHTESLPEENGLKKYYNLKDDPKNIKKDETGAQYIEMTAKDVKDMYKTKIECEEKAHEAQKAFIKSLPISNNKKHSLLLKVSKDKEKSPIGIYKKALESVEKANLPEDATIEVIIH